MAKKISSHDDNQIENQPAKRTIKKKMLPNVIDHCTKAGKIELQNLLFGTTEKKLLVSNEFLNSMTIKYVSLSVFLQIRKQPFLSMQFC